MTAISLGVLALVPAGSAEAHFNSFDSVDGCEIRWEDEMRWDYYRQRAQSAWEALAYDDCVDIEPDAWYTNTDLEWHDYHASDTSTVGIYFPIGGSFDTADEIWLNSFWMEWFNECQRRFAAIHELGHAHGLADNSLSSSVMSAFVNAVCTVQPHDIADYEALWGDSNPPPSDGDGGGSGDTPPTHMP